MHLNNLVKLITWSICYQCIYIYTVYIFLLIYNYKYNWQCLVSPDSTCVDGAMHCGTAPCPGQYDASRPVLHHSKSISISFYSSSCVLFSVVCMHWFLQCIVGGVSGRPGARAVGHVTWASGGAIVQEPIQRQRLEDEPVRANASDWTHAALNPASVQWSHDIMKYLFRVIELYTIYI